MLVARREWIEKFYGECGREVSLAYNSLNNINSWGITLAVAILAAGFFSTVRLEGGGIVLTYPTTVHLFIVIVVWIVLVRFFMRSCVAIKNIYRWKSLIQTTSKMLSLPEDHPKLPLFERNFIKKVKAYYYKWGNPVPPSTLIRASLQVMYLPFFTILLFLIMWGFVILPKNWTYVIALCIFIGPTAWEIHVLLHSPSFKYENLELEAEPEITELWLKAKD